MPDARPRVLRVALIAERAAQGGSLKEMLEAGGLQVAMNLTISDYDPEGVSSDDIDVLLVNLDQDSNFELDRLEALIERSAVPILFNEGGITSGSSWSRKLFAKLASLAQSQSTPVKAASLRQVDTVAETLPAETPGHARPALRVINNEIDSEATAETVWVLGSSLGGPQALKLFLSRLPANLPVGFVIAQHIGKTFVPLLAKQLGRTTGLHVMPAVAGRNLRAHEVILVPIDVRFALTEQGVVELRDEPTRGPYKPCIDEVMEEVARCYGERSGAIVLSGMGEDGALGAVAINAAGGQVWAQDADSCVSSGMPDATRRRGVVEFSGTPDELALRVAHHCMARAGAG